LQRIILSISISIFYFCVQAQPYDSLLKKLNAEFPQEKLYLQFDRAIYSPGETIWIKAYLFSGSNVSLISKTFYAELIDESGKVIERKTAPIFMSGAAVAFDLPASLFGSLVYIRAYTQWMLNFDSSFLYMRAIPVLSAKKSKVEKPVTSETFILNFFPEGGDLIQDIESRIAFKATNGNGIPIRVTGDILDKSGKKIIAFSSVHDGMGYFRLTPRAGEQYTARWRDEQAKIHETTLPSAMKTGVVIELNNMGDHIDFILKRSNETTASLSTVHLVANLNQEEIYRGKVNMSQLKIVQSSIPLENVPAGIVQVTLFTNDGIPIAERIVFVNKEDSYFITDLNIALKNTGKRKKNVIQIDVPDTIPCNLSVSVTDASINPSHPGEEDIFSGILLISEIRGFVYNPAYYFSGNQDSISEHLDLVMMTNGWRRFKWNDILAGRWPILHYLPDDYMGIEGEVIGLNKGELSGMELTGMIGNKNNLQLLTIPLKPDGKFGVSGMIFFDTVHFYYQINNDKNKRLTSRGTFIIKNNLLKQSIFVRPDSIAWLKQYKTDPLTSEKYKLVAEKIMLQNENKFNELKVLKEVIVRTKERSRKDSLDEEYTSGFFKGGDGYTFDVEKDPFAKSALSVLQYLQGKVPGLQVSAYGSQASLSWRGSAPALFIDEMQGDVQLIQSLTMNDVAMIKVYRPPFFGAFGGGSGGAIAVYTKKGASGNKDLKGLDLVNIQGYSSIKEFFSPDYSQPDQTNQEQDYRPTLYWNPYIITGKGHRRILLTFYNNDITNKFRVIIEGANNEGRLTRIEKFFE
jgi:hypothetical protein